MFTKRFLIMTMCLVVLLAQVGVVSAREPDEDRDPCLIAGYPHKSFTVQELEASSRQIVSTELNEVGEFVEYTDIEFGETVIVIESFTIGVYQNGCKQYPWLDGRREFRYAIKGSIVSERAWGPRHTTWGDTRVQYFRVKPAYNDHYLVNEIVIEAFDVSDHRHIIYENSGALGFYTRNFHQDVVRDPR